MRTFTFLVGLLAMLQVVVAFIPTPHTLNRRETPKAKKETKAARAQRIRKQEYQVKKWMESARNTHKNAIQKCWEASLAAHFPELVEALYEAQVGGSRCLIFGFTSCTSFLTTEVWVLFRGKPIRNRDSRP